MPMDPQPTPSRPRKPRKMSPEREMPKRVAGPAVRKPKKDDMQIPDFIKKFGKIAADPLANLGKTAGKAVRKVAIGDLGQTKKAGRPAKRYPNKGAAVDGLRKTKQAQAIAVEKVRVKKQAAVQSKRETGKAIKAATKKKIDNKRKTGFYEKPKGK